MLGLWSIVWLPCESMFQWEEEEKRKRKEDEGGESRMRRRMQRGGEEGVADERIQHPPHCYQSETFAAVIIIDIYRKWTGSL